MHGPIGPCIAAFNGCGQIGAAAPGVGPTYSRERDHILTRIRVDYTNKTKQGADEMTDTQVTWLTQESHDRLKAELDQLIANRPVIAAEINDRREEGDLRENGGYHAAREEQGQQEARIRSLQDL